MLLINAIIILTRICYVSMFMLTSFSNLETFTLSFELNANAYANVAKKQKGALNEHLFNASLCYIKKLACYNFNICNIF